MEIGGVEETGDEDGETMRQLWRSWSRGASTKFDEYGSECASCCMFLVGDITSGRLRDTSRATGVSPELIPEQNIPKQEGSIHLFSRNGRCMVAVLGALSRHQFIAEGTYILPAAHLVGI